MFRKFMTACLAGVLWLLLIAGEARGADNADRRLVEAARIRDAATVHTLLRQHANVNARSDDGSTALLWAAHWNDLATAELLVRATSAVNETSESI